MHCVYSQKRLQKIQTNDCKISHLKSEVLNINKARERYLGARKKKVVPVHPFWLARYQQDHQYHDWPVMLILKLIQYVPYHMVTYSMAVSLQ